MTEHLVSHPQAAIVYDVATGQCLRFVITTGEEDLPFNVQDHERHVLVDWPPTIDVAFELGFKAGRAG